jgi:hypothetical protein
MKLLLLSLSLMTLSASLLAQSVDSSAPKEEKYSLVSLSKYCAAVETFSDSRQPRVFAQVFSVVASSEWTEFSSRAAWQSAGGPQPLALVWSKDESVVRVVMTSKDAAADGQPYADYCYRPDGSLARLRTVPELQTDCDAFLFHCNLTFRGERLYPPQGHLPRLSAAPAKPSVVAQLDARDRDDFFLRKLQSEQTSISFAPMEWPEYLTVRNLPFEPLLEVATTMAGGR